MSGALTPGYIIRAVARSCRWPLGGMLAVAGACSLTGLILGYPYLAELALWLVINFACLLGGFLIHECAHALAGRRFRGISSFVVSSSMFRFSMAPVGLLYGWQIALMAVAGPVAAAAAGLVLWAAAPGLLLHWWFWPHLVFLAPLFGDGRSLVVGARRWSSLMRLHAQPHEAIGPDPAPGLPAAVERP